MCATMKAKKKWQDDFMCPDTAAGRPTKRAKILDDSSQSSESSEEENEGGITLKINKDYARRFEHNKKREELQRLEEKYGKTKVQNKGIEDDAESDDDDDDDDDTESESEDDDGLLATEDLDAEISATLQAIRSKDPRVYDKNMTFYSEIDTDTITEMNKVKTEKPMTLRDYHTKNLLEGKVGLEDEDGDAPPKTYAQEQEAVRKDLVKQMHAAGDSQDEEEGDFLVRKAKLVRDDVPESTTKNPQVKLNELDIESADKDPEKYLSNFLAARAWVPTSSSRFQPLESDDDEDDQRADEFEAAYNLRFEDPEHANEKLMTIARDTAAKYSVRREEPSKRRKVRDAERAKREAEKAQRQEEKARLRKLKIDEMEEKVKRIRKTAGLTGKDFKMDEWAEVLEADWDDDKWDQEMQKRFGDSYYEAGEADTGVESNGPLDGKSKGKKKIKKPKWDDDIDIKDLIPDFEDEDAKLSFALSSSDEADSDLDDAPTAGTAKQAKQKKKDRIAARTEAKRNARRDRRLIESLVDQNLDLSLSLPVSKSKPSGFRYRETSPTTFGLTPRDILLANDTQLNKFAGLKKMATFRDLQKKKKDKKNLSKKARLRQWRLETFGDEDGPKGGFETLLGGEEPASDANNNGQLQEAGVVDIRENDGKKKKKRSRKRKAGAVES
ncbi:Krr1-domain-containing protein [Lepidopterella palustris CBS 459.81]|uniref:Krr1-domain-containing protein n=1 Tax=Lepidopterella palustris CBS 459.81 TaxID=1314670 RepID=A0A8E2E2X5_9PEZI|nr:Krr1-domain-containing protein [Lepidopterella palustris CBS 459.81]